MDKHTYIGKSKIGSTNVGDFTDYQGIGHDPLYKRYDSVFSIVKKHIDPEYVHFFAAPHYSESEDTVNWYIDEWTETPRKLTELDSGEKERYQRIKEATVSHYKETLNKLSGEELQVMAAALRYLDDEFIFCSDDKVYVVAWGMTPDPHKHISKGELVHDAPEVKEPHRAPKPPVPPVAPPPVTPPPITPPPIPRPLTPPPLPPRKELPWYKKMWLWLTGKGCLKFLLWSLLALLLVALCLWLFRGCGSCSRTVGVNTGVGVPEKIVNLHGDTIDDNGVAFPIVDLPDGKLPDGQTVVAPIRDGDGEMAPIVRDPGVPPVIGNRLFIFLENDNDNVDAFAADFKKAYPGEQYGIIGFDRDVKSVLIQIPENERDEIRRTINSKIPNHQFLVFDEEIYELNGHPSTTATATPGWHLNAVKAPEGWKITKGSPDITVAVIDDGIDPTHPIFKGRIVNAYNVFTQDNKLSRGVGHGTHTAGLAVGSLDYLNQGAAGIAPDCKLMPVQVLDNGVCPLSALISGVMYAVHKGADVVNISIGPSFHGLSDLPLELQNEIARTQFRNVEKLWDRVCRLAAQKNTILVFAAGNDDIISSISPENRSTAAISVGAVDQKLYPTDFTNYGPCTDISAPGKEIYSSFPDEDFRSCDGTSMAAPIVSGSIALMKSLKRDLTVEQARNVLYKTGCDVYGNLPPMVQLNLALNAVQRGDFSAPENRTLRPVPDVPGVASYELPPSSWSDPAPGLILPEVEKPVAGVTPNVGARPVVPSPNNGGGTVTPGQGSGETVAPPYENVSDYEAIRRMIAIYKKKIAELERQLPENKK